MAVRQFALRRDDSSLQTGEISFKELVDTGTPVTFDLTNVTEGTNSELNLITRKNGNLKDHRFSPTFNDDHAEVTLSSSQVEALYADANDGDVDYIEARWTIGQSDTPTTSVMYTIQSGKPYDLSGWPAIVS